MTHQAYNDATGRTMKKLSACLLLLKASLLVSGCCMMQLQHPRALEPGRVVVGVAGSGMAEFYKDGLPFPFANIDVYGRVGLGAGFETGLRWCVPRGFHADVKYQFLRHPFDASVNLGALHVWPVDIMWGPAMQVEEHSFWDQVVLFPSLSMGTRNVYGGLRGFVSLAADDPLTMPGFFIGTRFGERFQLLPEVHIYSPASCLLGKDPWDFLFVGGCGVQYAF